MFKRLCIKFIDAKSAHQIQYAMNDVNYDKCSPNTCKTMHILFLRRFITTITTFKEITSHSLICTAQLNPKTITLYDVTHNTAKSQNFNDKRQQNDLK
jgi:hypothetical protein